MKEGGSVVKPLKGLTAYLLFDLRSYWREPMALLFTFVMPAMFFCAALIAARESPDFQLHASAYSAGYVGIVIIIVTLFTLGPSLVFGRELGFFKRVLVTPLDSSVILLSAMIRAVLIVTLGSIQVTALRLLISWQWPEWNYLQFFLAAVFCMVSVFSLGLLMGSVFKSAKTAFAVSVMLLQPLLFLSGSVIPFEAMSSELRAVGLLLPTRHMTVLLNQSWGGELWSPASTVSFLYLLLFGAVNLYFASRLFRWRL